MKYSVDVGEYVLWAEGRFQIALAVGDEFEAELFCEVGDEIGVEVRDAPVFSRRPVGANEGLLAGGFIVGGGVKVERKEVINFF